MDIIDVNPLAGRALLEALIDVHDHRYTVELTWTPHQPSQLPKRAWVDITEVNQASITIERTLAGQTVEETIDLDLVKQIRLI